MEVKQSAAGEQSPAKRVKFKLEFALLMLSVGRTEEAQRAMQEVFDLLEAMG